MPIFATPALKTPLTKSALDSHVGRVANFADEQVGGTWSRQSVLVAEQCGPAETSGRVAQVPRRHEEQPQPSRRDGRLAYGGPAVHHSRRQGARLQTAQSHRGVLQGLCPQRGEAQVYFNKKIKYPALFNILICRLVVRALHDRSLDNRNFGARAARLCAALYSFETEGVALRRILLETLQADFERACCLICVATFNLKSL